MFTPSSLPKLLLSALSRNSSANSSTAEHPQSKPNTRFANQTKTNAKPLTPLQQQILERIEDCYQQAEGYFKRAFPRPMTQFTLRGRSAGTAHLQQNRLRFNPVLLRENSEAFLAEVVPHEISHLLCFQIFGKTKPHGREWQSIMLKLFKVSPNTTHSFDTQSVKGKDVEYRCACGPIRLGIRRHNKVLRGETRYLCKRCHTHLTLAEPAQ